MISGRVAGDSAVTSAVTEVCAAHLDGLAATPRLQSVRALFAGGTRLAMVNETKGSYLTVEARDSSLVVSLYTSGIFDLYPIKREGAVRFCDDGSQLHLIGMDRDEVIVVIDGVLEVGSGGPKMRFRAGPMPQELARLHHINNRGIASVPSP